MQSNNQSDQPQMQPKRGIIPPPPVTNLDTQKPSAKPENAQHVFSMQPQDMKHPDNQPGHSPQVVMPQTPQHAQQAGINMQPVPSVEQPRSTPVPHPAKVAHAPTPNYSERGRGGSGHNLAGVPEEFMKLFEHDDSEIIMHQALRHPVGALAMYAVGGLAIFMVIAVLIFAVGDSSVFGAMSANIVSIASVITLFLVALIAAVSLVGAHVYKRSRMILTNQKVVLIKYHSLIAREVSQLNIAEVEDVNIAQNSIMDRILHTGTITIETSGEQNNYVLSQMQNPHEFARKTIQAHEGSIAQYGN